jgi:hypothetical protein
VATLNSLSTCLSFFVLFAAPWTAINKARTKVISWSSSVAFPQGVLSSVPSQYLRSGTFRLCLYRRLRLPVALSVLSPSSLLPFPPPLFPAVSKSHSTYRDSSLCLIRRHSTRPNSSFPPPLWKRTAVPCLSRFFSLFNFETASGWTQKPAVVGVLVQVFPDIVGVPFCFYFCTVSLPSIPIPFSPRGPLCGLY